MPEIENHEPPADTSRPPDWAKISEAVLCPLCDYNLRGLSESRCPECGYRFDWPEILDPRRRLHPYLFEHHPERNVWALFKTARGTCRPRRFWTSLHPVQPSRPRRLIGYWLVGAAVYLFSLVGLVLDCAVTEMVQENQRSARWVARHTADLKTSSDPAVRARAAAIVKKHGSIEAYMDRQFPKVNLMDSLSYGIGSRMLREALALLIVIPLGWPWVTLAALMVFRISMRRASVRSIHVLRCVLYSFDQFLWVGLLLLGGAIVTSGLTGGMGAASLDAFLFTAGAAWLLLVLVALTGFHRLWRAYRHYLRFDRPFWTVFASQFIVALAMLNVALFLTLWQH